VSAALYADGIDVASQSIPKRAAAAAHGSGMGWCNCYGRQPERLPGRPDFEVKSLDEFPKLVGAALKAGSYTVPHLRSLPEHATLLDLRRRYPLLELLRPYADRLMRGPSPLTTGERELIAAYVSSLNSCRYCYGSHALVARAFGIDERVLQQLATDAELAPVEPRLKPLLSYVQKLTTAPSRMTRTDADAVYAAGWSDEALLHAVAVCAYFNNMNRLVDGTGIVGSPSIHAAVARGLVSEGYTGTADGGEAPEGP
jgi:uncharacterized peroxidase-related enzyme